MTSPVLEQISLRRRHALGAIGALGAGGMAVVATPQLARSQATADLSKALTCSLTPSLTEGPYFVDEKLNRYDLTTATTSTGVLQGRALTLNVFIQSSSTSACKPLKNVQIDIWHANVAGAYSDIGNQVGEKYLRGYQITDANGRVSFKTIFPGWYPGRAVHIHLKARVYSATGNLTYEFNTQLFFDDALTDQIYAQAPYSSRGTRSTRNAQDSIYGGRSQLLVPLEAAGDAGNGLVGSINLGLAIAVELSTVELNQQGLTGFWFDPASSGQGFGVEVYPDAGGAGVGLLSGGWYTFDSTAGGVDQQRWYFLSGAVNSGSSSANLTLYRNTGGNFDAGPVTSAVVVGAAAITFTSCDQATLSYAFSDGSQRSGTLALSRLLPNRSCSSPAAAAPAADSDFGLSGLWFNPATSGQGLMVELNSAAHYAFVSWYSYAAAGANLGVAGQRWYSAQGDYAVGSRTLNLTLYETTGGVFGSGAVPSSTQAVGSITLAFSDCGTATLSYAFSSGANSGRTGSINLQRTGATPAGCVFGAG